MTQTTHLMRRPWHRATYLLIAGLLVSSVAFAGDKTPTGKTIAPPAGIAAPRAAQNPGKPLAFIQGIYTRLNRIATSSAKQATLHARIGSEMSAFMDYDAMSQRTLGKKTWAGLSAAQRSEFIRLLTAMVQKTFVERFKPGTNVTITYEPKVRMKKDGRAQVRTTIHVRRTSAAVYYSMIAADGAWHVYDIVVDEVSQLATYRRSFRRILAKEGWKGLVARMKKSA